MYKLLPNTSIGVSNCIKRIADNAFIPMIEGNSEYQKYLEWLAEGNTPEPADLPPEPTYTQLRAAEYPPIEDYIDGVVKGDQAQIDAYIAECLAVKAKYPKPA